MDDMPSFREPLMMDDSGLYITTAQMSFFLNRQDGQDLFKKADPKFLRYYNNCCLYNLIYDMMEEDSTCATMYWDPKLQAVAFSFPLDGPVAKTLLEISSGIWEEDDEDGDLNIF